MGAVPTTSQVFPIGQGDLLPPLEVILVDGDGNPVDLSTALSVTMRMWGPSGAQIIFDATAAVPGPSQGAVRYDWADGDTRVSGRCTAKFRATFPGTPPKPATFPNNGAFIVQIEPAGN